jgi:hypothetical protein
MPLALTRIATYIGSAIVSILSRLLASQVPMTLPSTAYVHVLDHMAVLTMVVVVILALISVREETRRGERDGRTCVPLAVGAADCVL